jgi:hypothetical protein
MQEVVCAHLLRLEKSPAEQIVVYPSGSVNYRGSRRSFCG